MTKTEQILDLLDNRGEQGAFNYELNKISFRYSARIHQLRKDGYEILTKPVKNGLYKFILVGTHE